MTIYGVDEVDVEKLKHPFATLGDTPEEWRGIFGKSLQSIRTFLAAHDGFEVLAKCINQAMASAASKKENPHWAEGDYEPFMLIEPAELEIVQALVIMQVSPRKGIPASPGSMHRFLPEIPKCTYAFSRMQPLRYPENPERDHLIGKIRMQTMFHRNLFVKDDCETVVRSIFQRIDKLTVKEFGFAFSEMFSALIALAARIEQRLNEYLDRTRDGFKAESESDALKSIEYFCAISPVARRAWAKCKRHCTTLDDLRWGAFQISELCHGWPYILDKEELRSAFGEAAVAFFERISLRPGELASANPEHFFMNNPVWRRPFVALDEHTLFLPLPNLFYSFPFQIFEQFLVERPALEQAYSDARAKFLEDMIETHVSTGMPSARTYQKVMWRDDSTETLYENDVVALIGNTIFLFEAKSGKLDDVARRGGELSLTRNFKELFVEPGEQARRLENYLNTKGKDSRLWIKDTNEPVQLDLGKPKVVHKFSICMEHFAALTSAKHNLKVLGTIKDENAWAPVLSLGELMLIWRYLDTEVSFFHYLTRRATLEEMIEFEGDEQDILSMYLINGLCIDPEKVQGRQLRFLNIDGVVRTGKLPRLNRTEFEILGIPLSHYWRTTLREIYLDVNLRHRFDILQVVLNQDPHALAGVADHARKWKRGLTSEKNGDLLLVRNTIGKRVFVLAYHLTKRSMTAEEWAERARSIARDAATAIFEASDCAVILRVKKSRETTYDALSFHRLMTVQREPAMP
jgi:hypothetical protein